MPTAAVYTEGYPRKFVPSFIKPTTFCRRGESNSDYKLSGHYRRVVMNVD